jgi:hypothetical protein
MAAAEERIDALYDLEPEDFVPARDQLVKDLRAEKDREGAKEVKALRRPTVTAWALNQFVRRHREDAEALVRAGRDAAEAQERAISGDKADKDALRGALRARHEAVQRASSLTHAILDERGSTGSEPEVLDALTAASSDDEVADQLLQARLSQPPSASSGLGSLDSLLAASVANTDAPAEPDVEEPAPPEDEAAPPEDEAAPPEDEAAPPEDEAAEDPDEDPADEEADPGEEPADDSDDGDVSDQPDGDDESVEEDEAAARRAAQDREEAEHAVAAQRSAARKLQIRALQAEDAAADADAEVTRAERALASARRDAEERHAEAERLRADADRAQQEADEAQARLED